MSWGFVRAAALAIACAVTAPACVSWQEPASDTPVCAGFFYGCSACLAIQGCSYCAARSACQRIHTPCTNRAFERATAIENPAECEGDAGAVVDASPSAD